MSKQRDKAWAELNAAIDAAIAADAAVDLDRPTARGYAYAFVMGYLHDSIPPSRVRAAAVALGRRTAERKKIYREADL